MGRTHSNDIHNLVLGDVKLLHATHLLLGGPVIGGGSIYADGNQLLCLVIQGFAGIDGLIHTYNDFVEIRIFILDLGHSFAKEDFFLHNISPNALEQKF